MSMSTAPPSLTPPGSIANLTLSRPSLHSFLSLDSQITIVPIFSAPALHLISQTVGPFSSDVPLTVPLHLALTLRRSNSCKLQPPPWLTVAFLENVAAYERSPDNASRYFGGTSWPKEDEEGLPVPENQRTTVNLPFYYQEMAAEILAATKTTTDIPSSTEVRSLLSTVHSLRISKIQYNLHLESTRLSTLNPDAGDTELPSPATLYNLQTGWSARECTLYKGSVVRTFNNCFNVHHLNKGTAAAAANAAVAAPRRRFAARRSTGRAAADSAADEAAATADDGGDDDDDDLEEPRSFMPPKETGEGGSRLRRFR